MQIRTQLVTRIALSVAVLGLSAARAGAGDTPPVPETTAETKTETTTTAPAATAPAVELPAIAKYDHGYKIKSVYDKFDDRTIVTLEKFWQDTDGMTNVSKYALSPRFWYEGQGSPPTLDKIHLELLLITSVEVGKEGESGQLDQLYKFRDPENRKLVFVVDGSKRVSAGSGEHDAGLSKRNAGTEIFGSDRKVQEQIVYTMAVQDWLPIVNGTLIEGRFGKKAFKMDKPKPFAALKDFTSRMRPEATAVQE